MHRRRHRTAVLLAVLAGGGLVVLGAVANAPAPDPVVLEGTVERPAPARSGGRPVAATLPADAAAGPVVPNAAVVRGVDGDTLVARLGGRTETVRLLGIDTPETHRPNTAVECFGPEASAALAAALPPGTPIRLERDVELRDRYGRVLAYVWRSSDGVFVNRAILQAGLGDTLAYAPNLAHADELAAAADAARAAHLGLWGACGGAHEPAPAPDAG